jgi:hypothetical protein
MEGRVALGEIFKVLGENAKALTENPTYAGLIIDYLKQFSPLDGSSNQPQRAMRLFLQSDQIVIGAHYFIPDSEFLLAMHTFYRKHNHALPKWTWDEVAPDLQEFNIRHKYMTHEWPIGSGKYVESCWLFGVTLIKYGEALSNLHTGNK